MVEENKRSKNINRVGVIGLLINGVLVASKLTIGFISGSIALTSDGFNNLSDFLNTIVTFIALKFSLKPADDDHPYGHERFEIIAGFSVAMIMLYLAIETIRGGITALFSTQSTQYGILFLQVNIFAGILKFILMMVYRKYAKIMESKLLVTNAWDSFFDTLISLSLILVYFLQPHLNFNVDAVIGILIGIMLIYTSIVLLKEFISGLLGQKPDPEEISGILEILDSNPYIAGYHDLSIHTYGKFHKYALVHIEVDQKMTLLRAHHITDSIEEEVLLKTGTVLDVHLDPLDLESNEIKEIIVLLKNTLRNIHPKIDFHDVRIEGKLLSFDLFNPSDSKIENDSILEDVTKILPEYDFQIEFEHINLIKDYQKKLR